MSSAIKFRGRILRPDIDGYYPQSQLELVLRAAIGSILCKPRWWLKWRGVLPAKRSDGGAVVKPIAETWLDETVDAVLQNRFHWMTKTWFHWYEAKVLKRLIHYPSEQDEDAVRRFRASERTEIALELWWQSDGWSAQISQTFLLRSDNFSFQECSRHLDSTAFLCWYFAVLAFSRRVKNQEIGAAWFENAFVKLDKASVHQRAIGLITAAHKGQVTKETFTMLYRDADDRPQAVDDVWFHVDRAVQQIQSIRACVQATLNDLIDRHDLMNPSSANSFISPGPVIETWMSDSIVSAHAKAKFVREVAVLEDVPEHTKDWHPGSNKQVLDLVHPSLYCCVLGETKRVSRDCITPDMELLSPTQRMYRTMFSPTQVIPDNRPRRRPQPSARRDQYQWIPSDFRVDDDGNVKILSYINNLHPVHHREMYASIEAIFAGFVPLFDRVLSWLANLYEPEISVSLEPSRYGMRVPTFLDLPPKLAIGALSPVSYSMRGTAVQVITKIAEIHLTPENPTYSGGSWHVEGTESEAIVATGIYYFGCENITESELSFRVIVSPPDYLHDANVGMATVYGLEDDSPLVQNLGAATAMEDRCIVFPNTFQHKVEPFKLADATKPGVRKILAFFIVNPATKIPSTSVIPPQQQDWLQEARREILWGLKTLPDTVVDGPLADLLGDGMNIEVARTHREQLMSGRGPFIAEEHREFKFSLCEH